MGRLPIALTWVGFVAGCGRGETTEAEPEVDAGVTMTLSSPAFEDGEAIPTVHTCQGADVQPELRWSDAPAGTRSFVLCLVDDTIDYVHWLVHDVPADVAVLAESASDEGALPAGAREVEAYGGTSYRGPCPPREHVYSFRVYALAQQRVDFPYASPIEARQVRDAFRDVALGAGMLSGSFDPE